MRTRKPKGRPALPLIFMETRMNHPAAYADSPSAAGVGLRAVRAAGAPSHLRAAPPRSLFGPPRAKSGACAAWRRTRGPAAHAPERTKSVDDLKSIAVPLTRRKPSVPASPRRRGRPSPAEGTAVSPAAAAPSVREPALPAPTHRYQVGQQLVMTGGGTTWARSRGLCRVIFLMPAESRSPLRYRVRGADEAFERIVDESDLALPL